MTLDNFEGGQTRRDYLVDGAKTTKNFCYKQPFGIHYKFIHQVYDINNRRNSPILVDITRAKIFWEDKNCAWYLATSEGNTNLAWGNFRQDGKVDATLDFWRKLSHECLVNSIGVYKDNEDVGSTPLRNFRIPKKVTCRLATAPKYRGVWISKEKKGAKSNKNTKKRCMNYPE